MLKELFIDIYQRILGKQRCVLFSNSYIDIEIIKQYKEIFDKNYMLSKTDNQGNVTFVNSLFLENYNITSIDIIGKSHNVIKCKITTKEEFKKLWDIITKGNIWKGIMTYTDKDNKMGYNSVTIYPIVDKNNKIIEFVSLRNDVSDIINLKKDIEIAQKEMIMTLGSIIESRDGGIERTY